MMPDCERNTAWPGPLKLRLQLDQRRDRGDRGDHRTRLAAAERRETFARAIPKNLAAVELARFLPPGWDA